MYTYEPIRCTPAEERLPYNRPDLLGRGVPSGRGRAGARPSRMVERVPPAGRVTNAARREGHAPAWPYASHPQTRSGRGEAGGPRSCVAVRVPPAGRVVPNAPRRLVDKPPYQSWCFCNYLFC